jgi:bifunctional DNA-binding transcriptional regulator/antitoxin component of YhaV-PrlF toxin-antitoxin module
MVVNVQISSKGNIALPVAFRQKYGLKSGKTLRLIEVGDGSFFLVPKASKVMKSADKVAKKAKAANVTLDDLLETLDEERKQYFKENYAKR